MLQYDQEGVTTHGRDDDTENRADNVVLNAAEEYIINGRDEGEEECGVEDDDDYREADQ